MTDAPRAIDNLKIIEPPSLKDEIDFFEQRIVGQPDAVNSFSVLYASLKTGFAKLRPGPIEVDFLAGPSGVGKTEMVLALAEQLGGDEARGQVIVVNCGEFQQGHAIEKLIGAPPGYIGSQNAKGEGGIQPVFSRQNLNEHKISFTDNNGREKSVVIILIDEAEKANPALHRLLLSAMDKGTMTMGNNSKTDFSDVIIFFTSNVGNDSIEWERDNGETITAERKNEVIVAAYRNAFPPEYQGRINNVIIFDHLTHEAIEKIVSLKLKMIEALFDANDVALKIEIESAALKWLITQGYNPTEGARALEKVLSERITKPLQIAHNSNNKDFNLNGRHILVRVKEDGSGLDFYYNENTPTIKNNKPNGNSADVDDVRHLLENVTPADPKPDAPAPIDYLVQLSNRGNKSRPSRDGDIIHGIEQELSGGIDLVDENTPPREGVLDDPRHTKPLSKEEGDEYLKILKEKGWDAFQKKLTENIRQHRISVLPVYDDPRIKSAIYIELLKQLRDKGVGQFLLLLKYAQNNRIIDPRIIKGYDHSGEVLSRRLCRLMGSGSADNVLAEIDAFTGAGFQFSGEQLNMMKISAIKAGLK